MSDLLLPGFDLLDRADRFRSSLARLSPPRSDRSLQKFSCKGFTSSTEQIVFKPSHARLSPPRPEVRCILQQSPAVYLRLENSLQRITLSLQHPRHALLLALQLALLQAPPKIFSCILQPSHIRILRIQLNCQKSSSRREMAKPR